VTLWKSGNGCRKNCTNYIASTVAQSVYVIDTVDKSLYMTWQFKKRIAKLAYSEAHQLVHETTSIYAALMLDGA
jgi:hypothetical protein